MTILSRSRILLALASALAVACSPADQAVGPSNGSAGPGGTPAPGNTDRTPPSVVATTPTSNATGVATSTRVTVTFDEDVDASSVSTAMVVLSPQVAATVSVSGRVVELRPAAALNAGSVYSVTVHAGIRDRAGNATTAAHSWRFTTVAPTLPSMQVDLAPGRLLTYDRRDSSLVCAASTGCSWRKFSGDVASLIDSVVTMGGRSAARAWIFSWNARAASGDVAFTATEAWLHQDANQLSTYDALNARWNPVVHYRGVPLDSVAFFMAGVPAGDRRAQMIAASTQTPAGTFQVVRSLHEFRQVGQYVPVTIVDERFEEYANGVGLVRAGWNFTHDDRDPARADINQWGSILLKQARRVTPTSWYQAEVERNDSTANAQRLTAPLVRGLVATRDTGARMTNSALACTDCIVPNASGQYRVQDWYTLPAPANSAAPFVAEISYGPGVRLDLYLFKQTSRGLVLVARDIQGNGKGRVTAPRTSEPHFVAVAARDAVRSVGYWLATANTAH